MDVDNKCEEVPIDLKNFVQIYKWPTMGMLRHMILKRKDNGLDDAFLKFGKRMLILPSTFFKLVKKHGQK